jgi:F0F1-type ATP synthase epsilon subunit
MANTLKLEIVTPEATVYSQDVDMVTLPAVNGQMGVLPQHVRLMTQMVPGEMIVRKDGRDNFLAVGEGLVEVTNERRASMRLQPRKHVNAPRLGCEKNSLPKSLHPLTPL